MSGEDEFSEDLCDACGDEINRMDLLGQDDDVDRLCQACMMEIEDEQL